MPQRKANLAIFTVRINHRNVRFVDNSKTFSNFKISLFAMEKQIRLYFSMVTGNITSFAESRVLSA